MNEEKNIIDALDAIEKIDQLEQVEKSDLIEETKEIVFEDTEEPKRVKPKKLPLKRPARRGFKADIGYFVDPECKIRIPGAIELPTVEVGEMASVTVYVKMGPSARGEFKEIKWDNTHRDWISIVGPEEMKIGKVYPLVFTFHPTNIEKAREKWWMEEAHIEMSGVQIIRSGGGAR